MSIVSVYDLCLTLPRYRTTNTLLGGILPGPKEQDGDQIQRFLRVWVNELLRLWRHGFIAYTKNHPFGILVRVILVCIICDKPAAHKFGGCGSTHSFVRDAGYSRHKRLLPGPSRRMVSVHGMSRMID
jgi:hypothetical protein